VIVTSPDGGESWPEGSQQTITWMTISTCSGSVKIEQMQPAAHSPDVYVVCRTLASSTPNDGSFTWTSKRCGLGVSRYKIRITALGAGASGQSDEGFSIPTDLAADTRLSNVSSIFLENPFKPNSTITLQVPVEANVLLAIYDVQGHRIRTLADETLSPGSHEIAWDGRTDGGGEAGSGVYYVRASIGDREWRKKLLLVR
jgi:hypothetical protein